MDIKNEMTSKQRIAKDLGLSNLDAIAQDRKIISVISKPKIPQPVLSESKDIDEESMKGRFGWTVIETYDIPFIFRHEGKYCSLRMLEQKIINKLSFYFQKELLNCTYIRYISATQAELCLLNAINSNHCDFQFGKERFIPEEFLINILDAAQLCQFFRCCYTKLETNSELDISKRCGFIRIDDVSVVPYSIFNEIKYVPVFYFEGQMDDLKRYIIVLAGWELSYLKFCCKIQGIRNELFAGDGCAVVSLENLKLFFPLDTLYEEFWPARSSELRYLKQRAGETDSIISISALFKFDPSLIAEISNNAVKNGRASGSQHTRFDTKPKLLNITDNQTVFKYKRNSHYVGPYWNFSTPSTYSAYKLQKIIIDNQLISCINMKPNDAKDVWVSLQDLSKHYFDDVPVAICQQVMNGLGIGVYRANLAQYRILKNSGTSATNDVISLVQVDQMIRFWPEVKYMVKNTPVPCGYY